MITDTYCVLHKTELNSNPKFSYYLPHDHHPHNPPSEGPSHHHHRHHHHHNNYHHHRLPQAIGSRLAAILANDSPEQEPVCRRDQTFHDPVGLYATYTSSLWPLTRCIL